MTPTPAPPTQLSPIPDVWRDLLEIARWTPSPHNTQPWKLRVHDDLRADLFTVISRTLPDEDLTGCFIRCAMGMFIESLAIAAADRGQRLAVERSKSPPSPGLLPFAHLQLMPDPSIADDLKPADILDRRTSRLTPDAEPVADDKLGVLSLMAARGDQSFFSTSHPYRIAQIMEANMAAVCNDLNEPRYHAEIASWFRFGRAHAERTRDGLDARCMNMTPIELYLSAKFPRLFNWPFAGTAMRRHYARRIGPVHQLGFLSGPFFEPENAAPHAGRTLMRLWLHMHRLGIGIHPFGNLVTNPVAHARVTALTGRERIWLVFRLGRTARPPRSLRLPPEDLLC